MISSFVHGKVYVFIDGANVFYSQRTLGWRISYAKLMDYLKRECSLGKCFVYIGTIAGNAKQKNFLDMLDAVGYIVRTKPVKIIRTKTGEVEWKGNLDMELGMEMIDTSSQYETAILISGDSDFASVIDRIKRHGKRILVMSTRGHISKELLDRAKYVDFRKLKKELILEQ